MRLGLLGFSVYSFFYNYRKVNFHLVSIKSCPMASLDQALENSKIRSLMENLSQS